MQMGSFSVGDGCCKYGDVVCRVVWLDISGTHQVSLLLM